MGLRPLFRIKSLTPDTRLTSQRQLLRPPRHFETPTPPGLPTPAPAHHHCCALHHRLQQTHRSIDFATPCFHRRPRHHQSSPRQPVQPPTTTLTFRTSTSKHSRASPSARHFHIRPAEWIFFSIFFLSFAATTAATTAALLADHHNAVHAANLATTATSTPISAHRAAPRFSTSSSSLSPSSPSSRRHGGGDQPHRASPTLGSPLYFRVLLLASTTTNEISIHTDLRP